MTTPPTTPRAGGHVFPGIAQFKAELSGPGHGPLWHLDGCVEDGNPDDVESWAWLAEITPYWGNESGDLARFLARAANSHNALVAALEGVLQISSSFTARVLEGKALLTPKDVRQRWAAAEAALSAAREEPS